MKVRVASLALIALAAAGGARAEQWSRFPREVADKAMARLPHGMPIVYWASHERSSAPLLCRLENPGLVNEGTGFFRIVVDVTLLATSNENGDRRGFDYTAAAAVEPEARVLDLAHVFVPSSEVSGAFVNLALLLDLKLAKEPGAVSLRVPPSLLGPIVGEGGEHSKPPGGGINGALGELAKGTQVELFGPLQVEGGRLFLFDAEKGRWELTMGEPSEHMRLLGKAGKKVQLRGWVAGSGRLGDCLVLAE